MQMMVFYKGAPAPRTMRRRLQDKFIFIRAFYNLFYQGLHPKPALLFSLQKSKQKASTPGSHKIYFYPGILQLPTVGQVKCLYTPLKINFIDGFKGVRLTANDNNKSKVGNSTLFYAVQNSTRVIVRSMIFQI